MVNREDLVFATCYQLAGLISSDWDINQPEEVKDALEALRPLDEPGEIWNGPPIPGLPNIKLLPTEIEPESIWRVRKLFELQIAANIFRIVMKHSDGWNTPDSDTIKKEIIARISDYDTEAKAIIEPVLATCNITL